MSKHSGACATRRRLWQRYPMFALVAGWIAIGAIALAGASQIHLP